MIKLTNSEKAARYDALQVAIKHAISAYKKIKDEEYEKYERYGQQGSFGAYCFGFSDGIGFALKDLERWADS